MLRYFNRANLLWLFLIGLFLVNFARPVWAFDTHFGHPLLTRGMAEVWNRHFQPALSDQDITWLIQGSRDEDEPALRVLNHFYDPIYDRGLTVSGLTLGEPSPVWLNDAVAQSKVGQDCSWDTAVKIYRAGDRQQAMLCLGHIVHWFEDAGVPAHVRNDEHLEGDPLEAWVKNHGALGTLNIRLADTQLQHCQAAASCLKKLASWTAENFFSRDTLSRRDYKFPADKIQWSGDGYGWVDGRYRAAAFNVKDGRIFLDDQVLRDTWGQVAPMVVGFGVEAMRLFFQAADTLQPPTLLPPVASAPFWQSATQILAAPVVKVAPAPVAHSLDELPAVVANQLSATASLSAPDMAWINPFADLPLQYNFPVVTTASVITAAGVNFIQQTFAANNDGVASVKKSATDQTSSLDASQSIVSGSTDSTVTEPTPPTVQFIDLPKIVTAFPVDLRWRGQTNDNANNQLRFDLDYKFTNDEPWVNFVTATAETNVSFNVLNNFGGQIFWRLRATDPAGHVSAWLESGSVAVERGAAEHIVISEVSLTDGSGFVELYNPTAVDVALSGVSVIYQAPDDLVATSLVNQAALAGLFLPAHGYFLLAAADYSLTAPPDWRLASGWSPTVAGGQIVVADGQRELDRLGWGLAAEPEVRATAVPPIGGSLERKARYDSTGDSMISGADVQSGNGYDSNINADDFIIRTVADPQGSYNLEGDLVIGRGLRQLWHFDDCRGGQARAAVGVGFLPMTTAWTAGRFDCAVMAPPPFDNQMKQTWPAWSATDTTIIFTGKVADSAPAYSRFGWNLYDDKNKLIASLLGGANQLLVGGGGVDLHVAPIFEDKAWHQVAAVFATDYLAIYYDGVLRYYLSGDHRLNSPVGGLSLVREADDALFDEVAIWSRAVSADELKQLFLANQPLSPTPFTPPPASDTELLHAWHFDDPDHAGLDSVGNAPLANVSTDPAGHSGATAQILINQVPVTASFSGPDYSQSLLLWYRNPNAPSHNFGSLALRDLNGQPTFDSDLQDADSGHYGWNGQELSFSHLIPSDGGWHHLAWVYDATQVLLTFYVDGFINFQHVRPWLSGAEASLSITSRNNPILLDDLELWRGALNQTQIWQASGLLPNQ